jgi:single-strand DNA-binding protein
MLNHVSLQGRLVRDPELRQTNSGVNVCSFTVAWSKKYKEAETQCFLPCTAWRGTGEFVGKYFSKGQEIAVEGELVTRKWQDKDGNNRSTLELAVTGVHFCGPKHDSGVNHGNSGGYTPAGAPVDIPGPPDWEPLGDVDDGTLPF